MLEDLWDYVLDFTAQFVIPDWGGLIALLPVAIFALVDIELSDVVPGANDNASGVATALSLADELGAEPPKHLDVWVVLPGAEECLQEGMRAFVRACRKDLDRALRIDAGSRVRLDAIDPE